MVEAIPFGVVSNILTRLASSAFNELGLKYGVNGELRRLENTLCTIKAALLDAEERQEKSHLVQVWIRKLKDVVFDGDDVLDAFATKALHHNLEAKERMKEQVYDIFSSLKPIAFRFEMGRKIKEIRERLDDIAEDMSKFNFRERVIEIQVGFMEREQTHSYIWTQEIIGRDNDKEKIIKTAMCSGNQENVTVIPIVGIGGLGKTALAQLVYNDERVVNSFEIRMWVCVSEDFDIKMLVTKILRSATNNELGNLDMDQLQIRLRENLRGKKYFLVLDEVWNENYERWSCLKNLLMGGAKGSTIVVTTRSRKVASVMGVDNPYVLKGLNEDLSWALFEQLAFTEGRDKVHPKLITIGKDIVKKCKGVPLAIRTVGSMMQSKSEESEWLSIQNNEIWALPQDNNDILPVLRLSYNHLPVSLRQCFAYCSIFPKDYKISKEQLIQLWMAQGYIQSSSGSEHLEDIGDQYFKGLLSRSFFQDVEKDDFDTIHSCKMHDLIHDLAQSVAGIDCCIANLDGGNISVSAHHISFPHCRLDLGIPRCRHNAKGMRTFLLPAYNALREKTTQDALILHFRSLRVLDLQSAGIRKLSDSLGKLKHLRYIDLSYNHELERLPSSISNLHNLQTLKLSSCKNLEELPRELKNLINLRYLTIDDCDRLTHMPTRLGNLISLQKLSRFIVATGAGNLSGCGTLNELNRLNCLRGKVCLENLGNVRDVALEARGVNLKKKKYLQSLSLKWGQNANNCVEDCKLLLENLQPHPNLRELHMEGYGGLTFSNWISSLTNLVELKIYSCERCQHLPPLNQLSSLKILKVEKLPALEYVDNGSNRLSFSASASCFPSLVKLTLHGLPNLKGWWGREGGNNNNAASTTTTTTTTSMAEHGHHQQQHMLLPYFPCLSSLYIEDCPQLGSMPLHPYLKEELILINASTKPLHQTMIMMMNMAAPQSSAAATTRVASSTSLSTIPSSSVFAPLSNLKSLRMGRINHLESLPEEWLQNLTSLEELEIWECPIITSLSRGIQHLTALKKLDIRGCKELDFSKDEDDGMQWKGLRSLRSLTIWKIPKLVSLPKGLQHVTTLQYLEISDCPGLVTLPEWIVNLTSLQQLAVVLPTERNSMQLSGALI